MFSLRDSFWVLFTIFVTSVVICLNSSPPSTWRSGKLWGWKVPKHKWLLCIHRVCSLLVMAQLKVTAILTKATLLNKSPEHVSLPGAALFLWLHPPKWFWKHKLKLTFRSKVWSTFHLGEHLLPPRRHPYYRLRFQGWIPCYRWETGWRESWLH